MQLSDRCLNEILLYVSALELLLLLLLKRLSCARRIIARVEQRQTCAVCAENVTCVYLALLFYLQSRSPCV